MRKSILHIVTTDHNRNDFTKRYLDVLSKQSAKDFKVINVDDGSTDGTSEMVQEEFFRAILGREVSGNLKWFTIFTFKNPPKRYLLTYWLNGIVRRIGGYLLEWISKFRTKGNK